MSTTCIRPAALDTRLGPACNLCFSGGGPGPLHDPVVLDRVIRHLGGLDLPASSPAPATLTPSLPLHLPVLVQAYHEPVEVPWVALHGGRVLGATGRSLTPKHRRQLRDVYRLGPDTKVALELYVEDRVLEGLWLNRRDAIREIRDLGFDLVLSPNVSVWRDACRLDHALAIRRSIALYEELVLAGVPAIPDVGFFFYEPDGRLWAEWVNRNLEISAISVFCGGRKIHAERRALIETVEDVARLHQAVRPEVAFVLGSVHAPERVRLYHDAAPGRRLCFCNGMAYATAQRRRLLDRHAAPVARSTRECFLLNCAHLDSLLAEAA
jgi:hypothetical protein